MIFPRNIGKRLLAQIESKEIIVLTGMRRTGKTTLLKSIFNSVTSENKVFFDIENIIEREIFEEKDYNNIINNLKAHNISPDEKIYVFIDYFFYIIL